MIKTNSYNKIGLFIPVVEFVSWKKSQGLYSFESLPDTVLVVSGMTVFNGLKKFFYKSLKGLNGQNFLIKNIIVTQNLGNGAPALLTHLEELRVLGVKNYFLLGWGGIINPKIVAGEMFLIEKTGYLHHDVFYAHSNRNYFPRAFYEIKHNLQLKTASCLSKDYPFDNTQPSDKTKLLYDLTDMETAAFHSFVRHYKLNGAALLTGADSFHNDKWNPPDNIHQLIKKQKKNFQKILTFIK